MKLKFNIGISIFTNQNKAFGIEINSWCHGSSLPGFTVFHINVRNISKKNRMSERVDSLKKRTRATGLLSSCPLFQTADSIGNARPF